MSKKQELQAVIADAQARLALFNTFPEDTYSASTVALFSSSVAKWFYLKLPTAAGSPELWKPLSGTDAPQLLEEWIYDARVLGTYFEVYILTVPSTPIYASA